MVADGLAAVAMVAVVKEEVRGAEPVVAGEEVWLGVEMEAAGAVESLEVELAVKGEGWVEKVGKGGMRAEVNWVGTVVGTVVVQMGVAPPVGEGTTAVECWVVAEVAVMMVAARMVVGSGAE